MGRKPTDTVAFKLRIRESLRRKIEKAAERKKISANAEAVERIEKTFDDEERLIEARTRARNEPGLGHTVILNLLQKEHGNVSPELLERVLPRAWSLFEKNQEEFHGKLMDLIRNPDKKGDEE
jgi:hypothetical protein